MKPADLPLVKRGKEGKQSMRIFDSQSTIYDEKQGPNKAIKRPLTIKEIMQQGSRRELKNPSLSLSLNDVFNSRKQETSQVDREKAEKEAERNKMMNKKIQERMSKKILEEMTKLDQGNLVKTCLKHD